MRDRQIVIDVAIDSCFLTVPVAVMWWIYNSKYNTLVRPLTNNNP
jgi:hypothetical protein